MSSLRFSLWIYLAVGFSRPGLAVGDPACADRVAVRLLAQSLSSASSVSASDIAKVLIAADARLRARGVIVNFAQLGLQGSVSGLPGETEAYGMSLPSYWQILNAVQTAASVRAAELVAQILESDSVLFPARARGAPVTVVPFSQKINGVAYAVSDSGLELPVIDLTHPAFDVPYGPHSRWIGLKSWAFLKGLRLLPPPIRNLILQESTILRSLILVDAFYVDGDATYLARLGSRMVPGSIFERLAAGSKQATSVYFRLNAISDQMAREVSQLLRKYPNRKRLHFIDIAGGSAVDVQNTLLKLRRDYPADFEALRDKEVVVSVLDFNTAGSNFGRRCFTALQAEGMPLSGLKISWDYVPFDWSHPESLRAFFARWDGSEEIQLASSEGGLVEYGSDADVIANLRELGRSGFPDLTFSASFLWEPGRMHAAMLEMMKLAPHKSWRLRGLDGNIRLAHAAGWEFRPDDLRSDNDCFPTFVLRRGP